jgi:hypothetical protein
MTTNFVLLYCTSCGEPRKIEPERVYENYASDFVRLRSNLVCPVCQGRMKVAPEYGAPTWTDSTLRFGSDIAWMR